MKIAFLRNGGASPSAGLTITGKRGMLSMLIDGDILLELGDGALGNISAYKVNLNKGRPSFRSPCLLHPA